MYDIIGDLHGCFKETQELITTLGYLYTYENGWSAHPEGRKLIFAGDLTDRGLYNKETLYLVKHLVDKGIASCIMGNHDHKLMRVLKTQLEGNEFTGKIGNGLAKTLEEFKTLTRKQKKEIYEFLCSLPFKFETEDLIVVHAAYKRVNDSPKKEKDFALFGEVDRAAGKTVEGFPIRLNNWKANYKGNKTIVHGHIVVEEPEIFHTLKGNKIIDIDTGCVFGGKLTAYRFPEDKFVSVKSYHKYWDFHKV